MSSDNLQDLYPLTPMQEGMLFHYLLEGEKSRDRYIFQFVISLKGEINNRALEESFQKLVDTYDILRTVFRYEGVRQPLQIVLKQRKFNLREEDLSGDIPGLSPEEITQRLEDILNRDKGQPFDLARDMPLRVTLCKTGGETYTLCWSLHHIIVDGWSVGILFRELIRIYTALAGKTGVRGSIKPSTSIPFRRYMEWLARCDRARDRRYWQEYLQGYETPAVLPGKGVDADEFQEDELTLALEPELVRKLDKVAADWQVTLNILFQCAWGVLLQRYNNTPDVVFGVVVSGRPPQLPGVEDMVGLFINTIPLRIKTPPDMTFSQLLQEIKIESAAAKVHEYISLAEIQGQSLLKGQLIDHIMVFENYPLEEEVKNWGAGETQGFWVQEVIMRGQAHYPFYVLVIPGDHLRVMFKYNARVYNEKSLGETALHLKNLLRQAAENPGTPIRELEILSDQERNRLIKEFNRTAAPYPQDKTIPQLWAEQVERSPDRPAITAPGERSRDRQRTVSVTFGYLYEHSRQLAGHLQKEGIGPGTVAALLVEPSVAMMTGIWGILLAGAAYLPIETGTPRHRIDYILADSSAAVLVTTPGLLPEDRDSKSPGVKTILLESRSSCVSTGTSTSLCATPPLRSAWVNSPVYILYTSGTTGSPKGVVLEHENLVNYVSWFCRAGVITSEDRALLVSSYAFDLGYTAIYPCLLRGGHLHLAARETYLWPDKLWNYLRDHRITYLKATPSLFQLMINTPLFTAGNCRRLRLLVSGGEAVNPLIMEKFFQAGGHLQVMNHYGPTETTIGSVACSIKAAEFEGFRALPVIGQPISNTCVYILGRDRELSVPGTAGEICIAGAGVSPGYLNQPQLTAEKFFLWPGGPSGYSGYSGSFGSSGSYRSYRSHRSYNAYKSHKIFSPWRVYRTGDLGRWHPDGNIQFLGRVDRQVKIRGYRVELSEIENQLRQLEQIEDAVVIVKENNGEKNLWAYIVPAAAGKQEKQWDTLSLRSALEQQLPSYMVPSGIVTLERIPLTPNGKIDQRALPEPQTGIEQAYLPPRTDKEKKIQAIWAEVLGIDPNKIGMDTNFFHLGGHSLNVMMMVLKVHKELGTRLSLAQVFQHPSIRGILAEDREHLSPFISLHPVEEKEYYETSPAQERLFVMQHMIRDNTSYNIPIIQELEGELDIKKLENIFLNIFIRHEILRTSFRLKEGGLVQRVHKYKELEFKVEHCSLSGNGTLDQEPLSMGQEQSLIRRFIRPFDLSRAPLFRVGLVRRNSRSYILMVDLHHIVSDGVTHSLLIRDFEAFYQGRKQPAVMIRYKDYAEWQNRENRENREGIIKKQESYWLRQLGGEIPVLELPYDYPRPVVQNFSGHTITLQLGREETAGLKRFVREQPGVTLFMVLVSIINIWLSRLSRAEDIILGTPVSGRRHADLEQTMGMFVNTLVLRNFPNGRLGFREFLNRVKYNTLQAYENQDYPFEKLVEHPRLDTRRDPGRNPLFDVMFVWQNIKMPQPQFPGLRIKPYRCESQVCKFDLTIEGNETGDETPGTLEFDLEYCTKLFKEDTILRYARYFKQLVVSILADPDQAAAQLEILPVQEKEEILITFNQTRTSYPAEKTLHELFTEQAEQTPDHIAVVREFSIQGNDIQAAGGDREAPGAENLHLSYRELAEESAHLAVRLREEGAGPGTIAAVMLGRSIGMIVGILGILKAGSAYLPIDLQYPQERINYILADSGAGFLLTAGEAGMPGQGGVKEITVSSAARYALQRLRRTGINPGDPLTFSTRPAEQPAYIIYTSGSSGRPKGVMVEHRSIVNYICWAAKMYVRQERVDFPLYTSIAFDLTVTSLFTPLITGNAVVIYPEEGVKTGGITRRVITGNRVGVIKTTPTHLKLALGSLNRQSSFNAMNSMKDSSGQFEPGHRDLITKNASTGHTDSGLKRIIVGGEELKTALAVEVLRALGPGVEIYNEYGPTEAAVGCMIYGFNHHRTGKADLNTNKTGGVSLGVPIDNIEIFILDKYLEPVPYGVPGEIYITGEGVARGYLNRPELTAENFRHDKKFLRGGSGGAVFSKSAPPHPLYKTGDLAVRQPGGDIRFLGRIDGQVKIRGYRIETGEIENRLRQDGRIKQVVVGETQDKDGDKFLCAYIVSDLELSSIMPDLKKSLSLDLPDYMVPSFFVQVETIPVTINGKVDVKKLDLYSSSLGPGPVKPAVGRRYIPPGNDMEKLTAAIWQEVLRQKEIGINDNFFDLGGNSLALVKVAGRLKEMLGKDIPVVDLFLYTTVAALAGYLQTLVTGQQPGKPPLEDTSDRDLQKREQMLLDTMELFQEAAG